MTPLTRVLWCCVLLSTAIAAPGDDEQEIRSIADRWSKAYVGGDKAGVLDVYTEDAWIMPNARRHLQGHREIGERFDAISGGPKFDVDIEIQELEIIGEYAWSVALYAIETAGAAEMEHGTGLTVYRKDADGRWRILRDIDNQRLAPHDGM